MSPLRRRMIDDMQIRNLTPNTQRVYIAQVVRFACHFRKSPELLGPAEIRTYLIHLTQERRLAASSGRQWPAGTKRRSVETCLSGLSGNPRLFDVLCMMVPHVATDGVIDVLAKAPPIARTQFAMRRTYREPGFGVILKISWRRILNNIWSAPMLGVRGKPDPAAHCRRV